MVVSDLNLLLIALVPALAFMVWVICALEKQIRVDRHHRDAIARTKGHVRSSGSPWRRA